MFFVYHSWSTWGLEMLVYFEEMGKHGVPSKKSLRAKERTNTKLNPQMALTPNHMGGGWVLSPLHHPSPAIIAKLHLDALCSIFSLTSFSHLATPCCVGHRHDVGWKRCVVFAGLYECCTVQYRSAYTLFSFKPGYIYSCMPFPAFVKLLFWFSLLVYQWKLMLPLYSDM